MLFILSVIFCLNYANAVSVVLTFDDTLDTHYQTALDLNSRNVKATFFVNSLRVNTPTFLTKTQLDTMYFNGHEVGGHTLNHANLSALTFVDQQTQICDDRDQFLNWGYNITNFAYPFGADSSDSLGILASCGYNGARDSGGIRANTSCFNCPKSEKTMPSNPLLIRSVPYSKTVGVGGMKWYVQEADADPLYSSGFLAFIFHEYGVYPNIGSAISPSELLDFVDWLISKNVSIVTMNTFTSKYVHPDFKNMPVPPTTTLGKPSIAFTFDYGTVDHLNVSTLLETYDFRGTFFVAASNIGQAGYLTSKNLRDMQKQNHEIGGMTLSGGSLTGLSLQDQTNQIQGNYNLLTQQRLTVTSFMWPNGEENSTLNTVLSQTGYLRARDIGGIRVPASCSLCPFSVSLPVPQSQKYLLRSISVQSTFTFGDLVWQVWQAENWSRQNPGVQNMLILKFERICSGCAYSPTVFENFLKWLSPRYKIGTSNAKINSI